MLQDYLYPIAYYRQQIDTSSAERIRTWVQIGMVMGRAGRPRSRWIEGSTGTYTVTTRTLVLEPGSEIETGDAVKIDGSAYRVVSRFDLRDHAGSIHHVEAQLEEIRGEPLP